MQIALLYAHWESFGEPWSTPMGIRDALRVRGHDVKVYNLYHSDGSLHPKKNIRFYSNDGLNQLNADIRNDVFNPEVIMVMDYGPWQCELLNKSNFPNAILIKEAGDEPQSHRMHSQTARCFDGVLSPDLQCVNIYNNAGIKSIWWTHHADTNIFQPMDHIEEKWDCVTTCGPRGKGLTEKIKDALGDRFENSRYYHGKSHAERLNMGKIVFQCSQFKEVTRRIFEGASCGKMVITDRLPKETGIDSIFLEDREIVYYDNADDAIDKIRYYSNNEDERHEIARAGMEKVLSYHTEFARVDQLEAFIEEIRRG